MKKAEQRVRDKGKLLRDDAEPLVSEDVVMMKEKPNVPQRPVNMIIPVGVMIFMMPVVLVISGKGSLMQGSGSLAVLWSVISGLAAAGIAYRVQGLMDLKELTDTFMKGVGGLIPLAVLMMLAFAIGDICDVLGTGPYLAQIVKSTLPHEVIPALLFLVSALIAFSTGTSWGTFAIMVPIGIPMVQLIGLNPALVTAAVLGGGVFGDHCSPISDTTIISSMASAADHIDHVRTQLPYALIAGLGAVILFLISGALI
jgi:Na+/H+ antiporter NhaC